jgi:hypothetical protein
LAHVRGKSGKKNRKWGRNAVKCAAYKARGQREINKERKARKHAKRVAKKARQKI